MNSTKLLSILFFALILASCKKPDPQIKGELKKWHRVTIEFDGPHTSELAEENPFLNYRLDVNFVNGDERFVVPGFYAADGNAAESSSVEGNKWIVRFTPNKTGKWNYKVSFKTGDQIAVAKDPSQGQSAGYMDGAIGTFNIAPSDKTGIDNRAKGRLEYVDGPYLRYAESKEYFIKVGVDAPENLLAYDGFDVSTNVLGFKKSWEPHNKDFPDDAKSYLWKGVKGKNLLGAIHYLATEGLNTFSFLTFNVDGDDRNVFPYLLKVAQSDYETYSNDKKHINAWDSMFHRTRFDISKLEQWERVFDYAETQGMFLHFKTNETETDHLMDQGVFGTEGKLYYRELIARFGHHLAMNWNLGEENNQPIPEVKRVANYVYDLDPYNHHLVIHTFPNQDDRYAELIGDQSPLTGASLQLSDEEFHDVHPRVLKWRHKSDSTGKRWALAVDEPGSAKFALLPDDEDIDHDYARSNALWGTLMAGGYGLEWYFGYSSPNSDLTCQDFRSRDLFWDQNRHARQFFETYLPFWEMEPADELTSDSRVYCFGKPGELYVVYLPIGLETSSIDLGESGKEFLIQWFNPREGGELVAGSVEKVQAIGKVSIGFPPVDKEKDWVARIILH